MPIVVRRFGRSHNLARVQELQVERRRQVRVVEPRVAWPHRILVTTEQRQSLADEGLTGPQRLRARDGPSQSRPAGQDGR